MRKIIVFAIFSFALFAIVFTSCKKESTSQGEVFVEPKLPEVPYDYFESTNINEELTTAGRVLFYDRHLSVNNGISCASCHKQEYAFGDNRAKSLGFGNKETSRQSISIHNVVLSSAFNMNFDAALFWDGRTTNLMDMVIEPTTNHIEMGLRSSEELVNKIKEVGYYDKLFADAGKTINIETIKEALALFVASLEVKNTKFDMVQNQHASFSAIESYGESIFNGKYNCGSCHRMEMQYYAQNRGTFVNIGLDQESKDVGRMGVTNEYMDNGSFMVPGLRNVQFSAPYMHDGRFETLNEVLDHYSHGVKNVPNLDWRLQDDRGNPLKMNITDYDKKAIIAFLNTLTDYDILTHDMFSNPFNK